MVVQWSRAIVVSAPHVDGFCQSSAITIGEEFATFGISIVLTVNIVNENQTIDKNILNNIRRVGRSELYSSFEQLFVCAYAVVIHTRCIADVVG